MHFPLVYLTSLIALMTAQDTSLKNVKRAFEAANIPHDLGITFDPRVLLEVTFPQADGTSITLHAGVHVPRNDTAGPPTFAITGGGVGHGPFVVAVVDPDAPTPQAPTIAQIRHFLGGNFFKNHSCLLSTSTPVLSQFQQPTPPAGSAAHRYIFLLFHQSAKFNHQRLINSTSPISLFNISQFADAVGLGAPIAGTFMFVAPDS